eukprot:2327032-Rhodomonas_salina.1
MAWPVACVRTLRARYRCNKWYLVFAHDAAHDASREVFLEFREWDADEPGVGVVKGFRGVEVRVAAPQHHVIHLHTRTRHHVTQLHTCTLRHVLYLHTCTRLPKVRARHFSLISEGGEVNLTRGWGWGGVKLTSARPLSLGWTQRPRSLVAA